MSKEHFRILKELASLNNSIAKLQEQIESEKKRIDFVKNQRDRRIEKLNQVRSELESYNQKLIMLEKDSSKLHNDIDRMKASLQGIITTKEQINLESQVEIRQNDLKQKEEESYIQLEKIELLENELSEANLFEENSLKSLNEIKSEVDKICSDFQIELTSKQQRFNLLLKELPDNFANTFLKISNKNLKYGPFSKITNGNCDICQFKADRALESEVEDKLALKTCRSCSRIFIPTQALY